ncbi:Formyltransferase [Suillus clintonianus]|uniref:Formyltransferase n=1 Tax=Suillus clintonianus TaxID=1904413 RepID=UPI001B87B086|nr:Formyltransferase [Suillus clintonianus]KAG2143025.1 Formyltransferase [Suillus clintonianus]
MLTQTFYNSAWVTSMRRHALKNCLSAHFYSGDAKKKPFDILFFGRDEFSCNVFKQLHDARDVWQSVSIATNPDVKTGRRGSHLSISPLKLLGESLEVPVHTIPQRKVDFRGWIPPAPFVNTNEAHVSVPASETHLLVTASFGRILRPSLLHLFLPGQRLNVHPSLLPAYRGPAPIQRALMRGERGTGVCVIDMMEKKEGIDAGSVWGCESMVVPENATFSSLSVELARTGGDLLVTVLRDMLLGNARSIPQPPVLPTTPHASAISASDAHVDFTSQTALDIVRLSRAISHQRPITTTMLDGRTLQLHHVSVSVSHNDMGPVEPGWAVYAPHTRTILINCADGEWLSVLKLKTQDRALLAAKEWWNGVKGLGLLHEGMLKLC